jgi:hypothetical protein
MLSGYKYLEGNGQTDVDILQRELVLRSRFGNIHSQKLFSGFPLNLVSGVLVNSAFITASRDSEIIKFLKKSHRTES